MRRPSNQEIERHYFEQFRLCSLLPEGEINYGDKPDVVISGHRTVGIEIANLYLVDGTDDRSEQVQRPRREAVVQRAQSQHLASGGRKIELSVDFNPAFPINDIPEIVNKLLAVAREVDGRMQGSVYPSQLLACAKEAFTELRWVYLSGEEYENARWQPVRSYMVPKLSVARVRELVEDKTKKLRGYRKCDAYWLLLIVDFMDLAQDQELRWPSHERIGQSPFEKIIIFKPQFREVLELPA